MDFSKCYACFFPIYFTSKSSNTNENAIVLHLCFIRPGVCFHGGYPLGSILQDSCLLMRIPDCGSPYITFQISQYIYPLCGMFMRLYYLMISLCRISIVILMYSYQIKYVPKQKYLMLQHMYLASGVEIMLLMISSSVVMYDVGVITSTA